MQTQRFLKVEKGGRRGGQSDAMWEELDLLLLALKMEKGCKARNTGGNDKEMDSALDSPD